MQQAVDAAVGGQGCHGLEAAIQCHGRLLRATRRAHQHACARRQMAIEPLGHAQCLAFALGGERALKVVLRLAHFQRLGVAPQDEVHRAGTTYEKRRMSACCALAPPSPKRW
jgi:hypothetical protein